MPEKQLVAIKYEDGNKQQKTFKKMIIPAVFQSVQR